MAKDAEKNDPIRQTADALDKWAASREHKLPKEFGHVSFYGGLLNALGNLQSLVEIWLRDFRPNQLNSIHNDFDELYKKAKDVGRLRSEEESSSEISVMIAKAAARELAEKLRLIADTGESYQKQTLIVRHIEDPAEIEQNATPSKIVNINNFTGILGDVRQADNLQVGDNTRIYKQEKTGEKKKGILRRIPYWIYILVSFLAALLAVFYHFGWIKR